MKIFGYTFAKDKSIELKAVSAANGKDGKRTVRGVIKKQPKREVSFQIEEINRALTQAKNADLPDRSKLHRIYEYILKDGHLKSQIRNAKFEVLSEPWLLYRDGKPDFEATKAIQKLWANSLIEYILEAELHGYSVVEGDGISPEEGSIGEVILIPREHISIEKQRILIEGNVNGAYLDYAELKETLELLEFGKRDDYGTLLECAYNVIWKYYSRSDWSRGSEKFGMPILAIEADTSNDTELDAIETRAANFGSDGYIVTQAGDKVTIVERKGDNMHIIWLDNIKLCNEEVSKIINGQSTTSDQKSFVGSAEVGERTMQTFTLARLQYISDEWNKSVMPYLVRKGFKVEGLKFDYPELIRQREKKMNGGATNTDAKPDPNEKKDKKEDVK